MPIPDPRPDELKDDFVSRCMGDPAMQEYEQEQRSGICYSQWKNKGKAAEMAGFDDEIEVFRAGEYPQASISEADLDQVIRDYDPAVHEAPLCLGHPADNHPAFGWVESLRRQGDILLAKIKQVVPELAEAVKQGIYKKRSASFLRPHRSPTGRWYLNHIAFLGAAEPQVKGLKDIAFADAGDRVDFEYTPQGGDKKEEIIMPEKILTQAEVQTMIDQAVAKAREDAKAEFTARADAQKKENEGLQAKVKAAEDRAAKVEIEALRKDTASFCEDLVRQGRLLPAMRDAGLVNFMVSLDGEAATVDFAGKDKAEKVTPRAWMQKFLEGLPKAVSFERLVPAGDSGGTAEFTALVEKYEKEEKLSHAKAVSFAAKKHPEIHAQYLQDLNAKKK